MDYLQDWLSEFTDEVVTKATDIVSKLEDLKGVEHTGNDLKNGFSVRLYSPSADYSMWVDVYHDGEQYRMDWNKYIFHTDNVDDMVDKCIQGWCNAWGDAFVYLDARDAAIDYLFDHKLLPF